MGKICAKGTPTDIQFTDETSQRYFDSLVERGVSEGQALMYTVALERGETDQTAIDRRIAFGIQDSDISLNQEREVLSTFHILFNKALNKLNADPNQDQITKPAIREEIFITFETIRQAFGKAGLNEIVVHMNEVMDNFDYFYEQTLEMYEAMGLQFDGVRLLQNQMSDFSRRHWDDFERFSIDSKQTASMFLKRFLTTIQDVVRVTDDQGNAVINEAGQIETKSTKNYLNMNTVIDFDTAYDTLAKTLAGVYPIHYDSFKEVLKERAMKDDLMAAVYNKLQSMPVEIQNDLVNAMGKAVVDMRMILVDEFTTMREGIESRPKFGLRLIESNRNSRTQALLNEWNESQKERLSYRDNDQNFVIHKIKAEKILNAHKEKMAAFNKQNVKPDSEQVVEAVRETLAELGIIIPTEVLQQLATSNNARRILGKSWRDSIGYTSPDFLTGTLMNVLEQTYLKDSQANTGDYSSFALNNPLFGADSQGMLRRLSSFVASRLPSIWAPATSNIENKNVFLFQDHNNITRTPAKLFNDANFVRDLLSTPFGHNSYILNKIKNGDLTSENFKVILTDGLRSRDKQSGKSHNDLALVDASIMSLGLFQAKQNTGTATFLFPTISDKSTMWGVEMPLFKDTTFWNINVDGESISFDRNAGDNVGNKFLKIVRGEYERIRTGQEYARENASHPYGEGYYNGSQVFILNHFLNKEMLVENHGEEFANRLYMKDGSLKAFTTEGVASAIKTAFEAHVSKQIQEMHTELESLGLLGKNSHIFDYNYLNSDRVPYGPMTKESTMYALADYYIENNFFINESWKIFSGDPAMSYKGRGDLRSSLIATHRDMQKRMAKDSAPAVSHNFEPGSTYNSITISDQVVAANTMEYIRSVLPEKFARMYENIELADAQEYTTLQEHIDVMRVHGKMNESMYKQISEKIRKNKGEYYELTTEEMSAVMGPPHKPVAAGIMTESISSQEGKTYKTHGYNYIKSSSIPLIPQMTQGNSIDNLRVVMENNDIQRAAMGTAQKLGAYNPVNIFEGGEFLDTTTIEAQLTNNDAIRSYSRDNFGLQFELPNKDKTTIKTLSQLNKNMLVDAYNITGFTYKGKQYTGRQLSDIKEQVRSEMIQKSLKNLVSELGGQTVINDNGEVEGINLPVTDQLMDRLNKEAKDREWKDEVKQYLANDGKRFILPLSMNPASNTIEALLLSLVKNAVAIQKVPGKSYVQVSPQGWDNLAASENVATLPDFEGELKGVRVEEGVMKPGQIVVPWDFKDSDGNIIPMREYTIEGEDGGLKLDMDRIDRDILRSLASRIPHQGPNSSLPVEIVGFTDTSLTDYSIVPAEIVIQMGADFDVDKINTYRTDYIIEEGVIKKFDGQQMMDDTTMRQLKQDYFDINWSVFTNPKSENVKRILKPLDLPYLKNLSDRIAQLKLKDNVLKDVTNPLQQTKDMIDQQMGKNLVGVYSNIVVWAGHLEKNPLSLSGVVVKADGERFTKVGEARLIEMPDGEKISVNEVIKMFQNAAVDNAKETILDKIRATNFTAAPMAYTMMLSTDDGSGISLDRSVKLFNIYGMDIWQNMREQSRSEVTGQFMSLEVQDIVNEIADRLGIARTNVPQKIDTKIGEVPPIEVLDNLLTPPDEHAGMKEKIDWLMDTRKALIAADFIISKTNELENVRSLYFFADTNGPGKHLLQTMEKMNKMASLEGHKSELDYNADGNRSEWSSMFEANMYGAQQMFGQMFGGSAIDILIQNAEGVYGRVLNEEQRTTYMNNLRSAVFARAWSKTNEARRGEPIQKTAERLLFGDETTNSLAQRVLDAKKTEWGKNSLILNRLSPKTSDKSKLPDTIDYVGAFADRTDAMRINREFKRLLASNNPEIRSLAEDLVDYTFLITGGNINPNSFAKYVPVEYLQMEGITDNVWDMFNAIQGSGVQGEVGGVINIQQAFIQHNPNLAMHMEFTYLHMLESKMNKPPRKLKDYFDALESNEYIQKESLRLQSDIAGQEIKKFTELDDAGIEYFRVFSPEGVVLYGKDPGSGDFIRLSLLGYGNKYSNLQSNQISTANTYEYFRVMDDGQTIPNSGSYFSMSSLNNNTAFISVPKVSDRFNKQLVEKYGEPMEFENADLGNLSELFPVGTKSNTDIPVAEVLNRLKEMTKDSNLARFNELVKVFEKAFIDTGVTIRFAEMEVKGRYFYAANTIVLSVNNLKSNPKEDIAETVLHEMIHAVTTRVERDRLPGSNDFISRIRGIMNVVTQEFRKKLDMSKSEYEALMKEVFEKNSMTKKEEIMVYSLSNIHEFITYALTNKDFQRGIKDIKVGDKSIMDRIMDAIANFMVTIRKVLGDTELSRESALYQVAYEMANFTADQTTTDTVPVRPEGRPDPFEGPIEVQQTPPQEARDIRQEPPMSRPAPNHTLKVDPSDVSQNYGQAKMSDLLSIIDATDGPLSLAQVMDVMQKDLGQTIGEFARTLTPDQRRQWRRIQDSVRIKCD